MRPSIDYITGSKTPHEIAPDEGVRDKAKSVLYIQNRDTLNRVMTRSHYGKWYMPTNSW
jgi:hypothetical protein